MGIGARSWRGYGTSFLSHRDYGGKVGSNPSPSCLPFLPTGNRGKFGLRLSRAGCKDHGVTCHPSPLLPGGSFFTSSHGLCHAPLSHHVLSSPPPLPPVATIPLELKHVLISSACCFAENLEGYKILALLIILTCYS